MLRLQQRPGRMLTKYFMILWERSVEERSRMTRRESRRTERKRRRSVKFSESSYMPDKIEVNYIFPTNWCQWFSDFKQLLFNQKCNRMKSDLQTETETQSSILKIVFIFWDKFYSALIPPQLVMTANWLYPSVPFSFSFVSQPPTLPSVNSSNILNKGHRWTVSWTSKSFHYSILGMLWAAIYLNCVIVSTDFVICDVPLSLQALHSHMNQL